MLRRPQALILPVVLGGLWCVFAAVVFLAPEAWPLLPMGAGVLVATVVLASVNPRWGIFGDAVVRGPAGGSRVALTFDDGPHPVHTRRVLEVLKAKDAHATFFVLGARVEEHPEVVAEIMAAGHQVALHGYSHQWSQAFRLSSALGELHRGLAVLGKAAGARPRHYRSPVGLTTPELLAAVRSFHLRYIAWSLRTLDGAGASAAAVLSRVQSKLSDGDIVLLHDAPPVGGGEREPIAVQVLPRILECLDERGLRSVTVAELLDEEPYLSGERGQLAAAPISLSDVRFPRIPFVVLSTLVVLLLASVSLARASEPGLPTGLLEAATRLQEHETLVARFVQTKESLLFEEPVRQTGRMELRRSDGRLRWSYDAGPSILLAEGRIYVSGKDGRIRGPGQRIPGGGRMVQVLRGLFTLDPGVLGTSFAVDDLGSGRYSLQSKEKGAAFPQVLLSLSGSPELLRDIELSEASGDRLHLHFDALEPNAAIPADRLALPSERRGEGEPRASSEGERQP